MWGMIVVEFRKTDESCIPKMHTGEIRASSSHSRIVTSQSKFALERYGTGDTESSCGFVLKKSAKVTSSSWAANAGASTKQIRTNAKERFKRMLSTAGE